MTTDGEPSDGHVDVLWYVDVNVPEPDEYPQRALLTAHLGFTQVEVYVAERSPGNGPAPQPESPTLDDVGKKGGRQARCATRRWERRRFTIRRQPRANALEIRLNDGCVNLLDPLGELLQRKAPRE